MKAVLLSIQPKWCELIASGKKTVEVRKTRPKIETPFKAYIYCTKKKKQDEYGSLIFYKDDNGICEENGERFSPLETGKVIGEFVCDRVIGTCPWRLKGETGFCAKRAEEETNLPNNACLTLEEIEKYAGSRGRGIYGWHITDLVVYDEPMELSEFVKPCNHENDCCTCDRYDYIGYGCYSDITRPPQSWCYVEERSNGDE